MVAGLDLVLASASPRRRQLLAQMGLRFEVHPSDVDEPPFSGGDPAAYATGLAISKAEAVARRFPDAAVLGADTVVVVDDAVLGKPADDAEATAMLGRLSGRGHTVFTAVAVRGAVRDELVAATDVYFRPLAPEEIAGYVATGEGRDKAGAYGIQEIGAGLVERVVGSYTNVVGLPVAETIVMLRRLEVLSRWP